VCPFPPRPRLGPPDAKRLDRCLTVAAQVSITAGEWRHSYPARPIRALLLAPLPPAAFRSLSANGQVRRWGEGDLRIGSRWRGSQLPSAFERREASRMMRRTVPRTRTAPGVCLTERAFGCSVQGWQEAGQGGISAPPESTAP